MNDYSAYHAINLITFLTELQSYFDRFILTWITYIVIVSSSNKELVNQK